MDSLYKINKNEKNWKRTYDAVVFALQQGLLTITLIITFITQMKQYTWVLFLI